MDRGFVYILRCRDQSLYTGWTNNLNKRLLAHNKNKGAKYTRGRTPVELVYYEYYLSRQLAQKREYAIKQLRKDKKYLLIDNKNFSIIKNDG